MKHHLLIVDDEAPVCSMLKRYLEKNGYRVSVALNPREASAILDERSIHLILLDIVLDGSDGMELLKKFKLEHPNLPVVLLTGLGFDEHLLQEAAMHGASGFLSKTLPLNQVLLEIHRVLNYRQSPPPK